ELLKSVFHASLAGLKPCIKCILYRLASGEEEAAVGGRGEDNDDRQEEEAAAVVVVRTMTTDGGKQQAPLAFGAAVWQRPTTIAGRHGRKAAVEDKGRWWSGREGSGEEWQTVRQGIATKGREERNRGGRRRNRQSREEKAEGLAVAEAVEKRRQRGSGEGCGSGSDE
ncbi:hypothetical protein B296_00041812, partial [Ensete ventricosum]